METKIISLRPVCAMCIYCDIIVAFSCENNPYALSCAETAIAELKYLNIHSRAFHLA